MSFSERIWDLKSHFPSGIVQVEEAFGETTLEVSGAILKQLLTYLKITPGWGFEMLVDLTGIDELHPVPGTHLVYWLSQPWGRGYLRVACFIPREEVAPSVVDLWEGANWYERELYDLFGVQFEGHPDLKRILMPDDWAGHPLRRDYPLTEEPVQFFHGAKPKIPSEIIPHA